MEINLLNQFSKEYNENLNCINLNYCNSKVKTIYEKHKELFNHYYLNLDVDYIKKDHYIYAWRTKSHPHKYFYVGKGCKNRYKHIERELKDFETGKTDNKRSEYYSKIKQLHGIECVFLEENLSNYESVICELCYIHDFIAQGEFLFNSHYMPENKMASWLTSVFCSLSHQEIIDAELYNHYISDTPLSFDNITDECLAKTYFHEYYLDDSEINSAYFEQLITNWINKNHGKLYKSISTKTKSIIVFGGISVEKFIKLQSEGKQIYCLTDVMDFINNKTSL